MTLLADAALARRAPRPVTLGFVLMALVGVLLVIGHGDPTALLHGGVNGGDLLVLIGTASFVVYTFGARRFGGYTSLRYTALSATGGTLTVIAVTAVADRGRLAHDARRPATWPRSGGSSSTSS